MKDLIIIGGGPAGYVAGIRAKQLGLDAVVIEKERIGGTCLNRGCIPTKALFRTAEIIRNVKISSDFGIVTNSPEIDFGKVMQRKNDVTETLVSGVEKLMKANGAEVIEGDARFIDKNTVEVNGERIEGKNILIATGSVPTIPNMEGVNLKKVITSRELLELKELPKSLIVVGGGVVGMEFASIFNELGTEVSVVASSLLKRTDMDIQKRLSGILKKQGMNLILKSRAKRIEQSGDLLELFYTKKDKEESITAEYVLLAAGRRPNIESLNLEDMGITHTGRGIEVDESFKTNIDNIYAVGDITGGAMLAHVASHEALYVVERLAGLDPHINFNVVPDCVFIHPEVSSVGMTEEDAKEAGISYKTSRFMFTANGKALSLGETDGFVKVISSDEDRIIGVHIMGPHASDLIHEGALAISAELKADKVKHTIHAHPTLAESFSESVMGLSGEAIHMINK